MKNILFILVSFLLFTNCEDVVDVEVPNGEPRLVIDASLEFFTNETGAIELGENTIRLTMSAPFFNEEVTPVSDASIVITDVTNDFEIIRYWESFEPGVYTPSSYTVSGYDLDSDYELTIIHDGETYKATTKIIPTVPIDGLEQGDGTLFDGDETEVIVTFTDDGMRDDFYLFDFDFSLFLASEDRFYQGTQFNFSYFYENMVDGKNIVIKILGIDEQYYNYINLLIEQSGQDGGGPFQAPPATLKGNIVNITNPDNYPLGYFNLSETEQAEITIAE